MSIQACPYCGSVTSVPAVLAGHTRQECEAKIRARIQHYEGIIERERASLAALHAVANRDQAVAQ